MKHTLLFLFTLLSATFLWAQDMSFAYNLVATSEVPEVVRTAQENQFPDGYVKEWHVDKGLTATDDEPVRYKSVFSETGGTFTIEATYIPNGMLVYHSEFMRPNRIPSHILIKVREEYDRFEVIHANFITVVDPKFQLYQVELRDQGRLQLAHYTLDGAKIPKAQLPEALLVFKY